MEGIEEALYWHTIGILADAGSTLGTAVAIRYHNHSILLTATHVIKNTPDGDLRFYFRPAGTVVRGDFGSMPTREIRTQAPLPIQIFDRFQDKAADLAALIVTPTLEKMCNVLFYTINDRLKLPKPIPSSVAAIGYPADSRKDLGPHATLIAACSLWGNVQRGKHWRPSDYKPRSQLLLKFLPADLGRHPGGFSGAGIWYHSPTPKPGVWFPNLGLAGICTHYFPGKKLLLILRVERIASFLKKIAPE